jgi:NitT/TauT family transport system substrate-binding protein
VPVNITVAENFRAVFYAPFYALRVLDFAAREGLDIEWLAPGSPGGAIDDVKSGKTDATFGGPMRVLKDHDSTPADGASLVCFGEVVTRDPFYLVGRGGRAPFALNDLAGLRTGIVSEVPTPWHCLRADLEDAGMDTAAMRAGGRFVTGLGMAQQIAALKAGEIDVAQLFEPLVSELVTAGSADVLYAACGRGPTVYTTFICSREGLAKRRREFAALTRALQALLAWMAEKGPAELARVVAPFFPDVTAPLLRSAIERYVRDGIWSRETAVSEPGFERLAHSLEAGGFIQARAGYADCVHNF